MIGLDLDGTLLNEKKEISPYSRDVIKRALDAGVIVLVATLDGDPGRTKGISGDEVCTDIQWGEDHRP